METRPYGTPEGGHDAGGRRGLWPRPKASGRSSGAQAFDLHPSGSTGLSIAGLRREWATAQHGGQCARAGGRRHGLLHWVLITRGADRRSRAHGRRRAMTRRFAGVKLIEAVNDVSSRALTADAAWATAVGFYGDAHLEVQRGATGRCVPHDLQDPPRSGVHDGWAEGRSARDHTINTVKSIRRRRVEKDVTATISTVAESRTAFVFRYQSITARPHGLRAPGHAKCGERLRRAACCTADPAGVDPRTTPGGIGDSNRSLQTAVSASRWHGWNVLGRRFSTASRQWRSGWASKAPTRCSASGRP